ncbi:hypothetical protein BDV24DRAFT_139002 [Aspergillus arachidicola]|uniref:Uncharacterized protein n=1 Tax=Aspergillus arachidicola TaxID=656916 RepID=A0A5N6XXR2_9EURO|nr:hypothetical protein BDV24DRAFT_139002 [Aspergillus arachidicola]
MCKMERNPSNICPSLQKGPVHLPSIVFILGVTRNLEMTWAYSQTRTLWLHAFQALDLSNTGLKFRIGYRYYQHPLHGWFQHGKR